MTSIISKVLSNGYSLILPILLWNILLARYLPPAYEIKSFNTNIPSVISTGELIGRILIFGFPLLMQLNFSGTSGKAGLVIYAVGLLIYFLSWLLIIVFPQSVWSTSMLGFTAPAYTIIIWLVGFSILSDSFYFKIPFSKWYLIVSTMIMTGFHFSHAFYVWHRTYH